MSITSSAIDNLIDVTDFDFLELLDDYQSFVQNQYGDIVDFYEGSTNQANTEAFDTLADLRKRFSDLMDIIYLSRDQMTNYESWQLIEYIEEIVTKLDSANNLSKWLRSSRTSSSFNTNPEVQYVLNQYQNLESVAENNNYNNPQDDWTEVALRNGLTEEDYTWEGGNILYISSQNAASIFIQGVVDNLIGDALYGRDIDKKFTIVDSDIKALTYKETLFQSVEILVSLRKRDNPYYPNDGLQTNIAVGSSLRGMSVAAIIRQLTNTFLTDDTMQAIGITKVDFQDDTLKVEFNVKAKDKLVIPGTTLL